MKIVYLSILLRDSSDDSLAEFGSRLVNYLENGGFETSNVRIEKVGSQARLDELTGKFLDEYGQKGEEFLENPGPQSESKKRGQS